MKRAVYLYSLLDARDHVIASSVLAVLLALSAWGGYAVGARETRTVRTSECERRLEATARRHGLQLVRVALPCVEGRR